MNTCRLMTKLCWVEKRIFIHSWVNRLSSSHSCFSVKPISSPVESYPCWCCRNQPVFRDTSSFQSWISGDEGQTMHAKADHDFLHLPGFFVLFFKKGFFQNSLLLKSVWQTSVTANSEEKKQLSGRKKKKSKLDFRKGHSGQWTWKKKPRGENWNRISSYKVLI